MNLHEAAKDLWWCVLFCFVVMGISIYLDNKKEK